MATKQNQGTFRATGISLDTGKAEFLSALSGQLTSEEEQKFKFNVSLAPNCTDPATQIAIFKIEPSEGPVPSFLMAKHPSFVHRVGGIDIDSDFFGLTQLYPVAEDEIDIE
ncbi:hypothetical protein TWF718_005188 [Orbilia javanica]|uniref:Uncharacterized protein n=1 Tax=Orbilia javanica TaxID=47235 RepID=A0AAN8MWH5_9PEZI